MRSKIPVSGRETEPLLRVSIAPYNDESDLDPTAPGAPAPAGRRVPGALTPADELAVAGDTVGAVGVDEVAASAAPDRVAGAVCGVDHITAGPAEQPVSSTAGEQDVVS